MATGTTTPAVLSASAVPVWQNALLLCGAFLIILFIVLCVVATFRSRRRQRREEEHLPLLNDELETDSERFGCGSSRRSTTEAARTWPPSALQLVISFASHRCQRLSSKTLTTAGGAWHAASQAIAWPYGRVGTLCCAERAPTLSTPAHTAASTSAASLSLRQRTQITARTACGRDAHDLTSPPRPSSHLTCSSVR